MSAARNLAGLGNQNTFAVESVANEVGIASTAPSSTLDVRGEVKVGTNIQLGSAGVITASSYTGSFPILDASSLAVSGISTLVRLAVTDEVVTGIITALGLSGNLTGAAATITGALNVDGTTDSTSTTTGALIVDGGAAIAKNVYIGAGLSVAGTLTYEDVTSVDSVGLITAKSGVNITGGELTVGSGITMGIAGVATFSGTGDVHLLDNVRLNVGDASDLTAYHDGSNSKITHTGAGGLYIGADTFGLQNGTHDENYIVMSDNGSVDLYYDNVKVFNTDGNGIMVRGPEGGTANVYIYADEGDDNSDKFQLTASDGGPFIIGNRASGSVETNIECNGNGNVELYYDNSKKFETTDSGTITTGVCTATDFSGASGGAADFPNGLSAADEFNTTSNIDINANSMLRVGSSQNFQFKYTGSEGQIIQMDNSNPIRIKVRDGAETAALFNPTGSVDLYFDDSAKLYTTNEGVTVSGMMSTSAGLAVTGGMWEGAFYKVGKLSDNQTIGISTSNIFVFATTENTTSTPNIIWNDTYPLSSKMKVGDVVTVTVISVAAAGGYSANWTIDGNAISEQWNGGSAPSAGGSDGFDIYTHTIVRKGTGTGDSGWLMFSNVSNFT